MAASSDITILMPCKDQKREFLADAVDSVLKQTSPAWRLLVIIDRGTPPWIQSFIESFRDERITVEVRRDRSFASALNTGMERATTEFVTVLFSDDRLDPRAVEILQARSKAFPDVDLFYSSCGFIDAKGRRRGPVRKSRESFEIADFKQGSPVKHLLCWRRAKGLEIGGMDEETSRHGCDDFDFPWSMAEAGCKFRAIAECLYYGRNHHDFFRLTIDVPVEEQVEILRKIFRKHGASDEEASQYIEKAKRGYLMKDKRLPYEYEEEDVSSGIAACWKRMKCAVSEWRDRLSSTGRK